MLPNWLYGKSKSKLANILGGGGGTPADYNQVKAQVKQLTQDTTALLDNTEVNGAVNIAPFDGTSQLINGVNVTFNTNGSITADGANQDKEATANIRLHIGYFTLRKGIVYKVSANKDGSIYSKNSGRCIAVRQKSDSAWKMSTDKNGANSAYYRPLADDEMEIILAINTGLYVDNLTFYPMVTVASYNGVYVPYAKTNKELTDELTVGAVSATANTDYLNGSNNVIFRKYGKMVSCEGYFQVTTAAAKSAVLYTLAELPLSNSYLLALKGTGVYVLLNAKSDGTIIVESEDGIATGFYSLIGNFVLP